MTAQGRPDVARASGLRAPSARLSCSASRRRARGRSWRGSTPVASAGYLYLGQAILLSALLAASRMRAARTPGFEARGGLDRADLPARARAGGGGLVRAGRVTRRPRDHPRSQGVPAPRSRDRHHAADRRRLPPRADPATRLDRDRAARRRRSSGRDPDRERSGSRRSGRRCDRSCRGGARRGAPHRPGVRGVGDRQQCDRHDRRKERDRHHVRMAAAPIPLPRGRPAGVAALAISPRFSSWEHSATDSPPVHPGSAPSRSRDDDRDLRQIVGFVLPPRFDERPAMTAGSRSPRGGEGFSPPGGEHKYPRR